MTELESAWTEARSFVEKYPPNEAEYIGKIKSKHDESREYHFYKDKDGGYWYETRKDGKRIS